VHGGIVGVIVVIFVLAVVYSEIEYPTSEAVKLIKDYICAKKQGICPLVEFTDKEEK